MDRIWCRLLDLYEFGVRAGVADALIFSVLHGGVGEDGQVQELMESLGVPFVGSPAQATVACADKVTLLQLPARHGPATQFTAPCDRWQRKSPPPKEARICNSAIVGHSSLPARQPLTPAAFEWERLLTVHRTSAVLAGWLLYHETTHS